MRGQKAETAVEYKDVNLRRLRGRLWRLFIGSHMRRARDNPCCFVGGERSNRSRSE